MAPRKPALKRAFIFAVIGSLVASALMGIWVIIQGSFGDTDWKILFTTLSIGLFSITGLSSLRTLESASQKLRIFSQLSIVVSIAAFLLSAWVVWAPWDGDEEVYRLFFSLMIVAVSMAHAILLLPLLERGRTARTIVDATVGCVAVVALILIYLIVQPDQLFEDGGLTLRILAVFAILDVLGTIVSPIAAKFLGSAAATPTPAAAVVMPSPASTTAPIAPAASAAPAPAANQKSPNNEAQSNE